MKLAALVVVAFAGCAFGQLTPTGPFTGQASEGFEGHKEGSHCGLEMFGGHGWMGEVNGGCAVIVSSFWAFGCKLESHEGKMFSGSKDGPVYIKFDPPLCRFGGYFATNIPKDDWGGESKVAFFDDSGNHFASEPILVEPNCEWTWFGWESTVPIRYIEFHASNNLGGGHLMMDGLEISFECGSTCYPDCENDGDLDIFDYLCFLGEYANQSAYADCEGDGDWDVFDYLCFLGQYANGCN